MHLYFSLFVYSGVVQIPSALVQTCTEFDENVCMFYITKNFLDFKMSNQINAFFVNCKNTARNKIFFKQPSTQSFSIESTSLLHILGPFIFYCRKDNFLKIFIQCIKIIKTKKTSLMYTSINILTYQKPGIFYQTIQKHRIRYLIDLVSNVLVYLI